MNQIHPEPLSGTLVDILEETAARGLKRIWTELRYKDYVEQQQLDGNKFETPRRSSRAIPNCCATPKRWRRCCIGAGSGPVRR